MVKLIFLDVFLGITTKFLVPKFGLQLPTPVGLKLSVVADPNSTSYYLVVKKCVLLEIEKGDLNYYSYETYV
jgi:hypothetical protein